MKLGIDCNQGVSGVTLGTINDIIRKKTPTPAINLLSLLFNNSFSPN